MTRKFHASKCDSLVGTPAMDCVHEMATAQSRVQDGKDRKAQCNNDGKIAVE